MNGELVALINGQEVGRVRQDRTGRLRFVYDEVWRHRDGAYPLSLSLPLARAEHGDEPIRAYLAGLLPDNDRILARWGQKYGVSPRNPFSLVAHVGEDLAGAVQFVEPERVAELRNTRAPEVQWLTETDVARRLRDLAVDQAAWREPGDAGQFSLAGAQPKTAFLYDYQGKRWGVPAGRIPTTHILKPPVVEYDGFAENEHVCLRLAGALGLPVARSEVRRFEDQVAIVVERYDRQRLGRGLIRVHQEDFCQALGVTPILKYENEGGPGVAALAAVLREHSADPGADLATLVDALALNWVIGGTDAHAKNFSVLFRPGGKVRLSPVYDVASALPYPTLNVRNLRLAMKIGGEYLIRKIGRRHWERLAAAIGADAGALVERVRQIAVEVPDRLREVRAQAEGEGLQHPVLARLEDAAVRQARSCIVALDRARTGT